MSNKTGRATADQRLMMLEAEIVGKVAKESDNLPHKLGHMQSYSRGFLEALEWVLEQMKLEAQ